MNTTVSRIRIFALIPFSLLALLTSLALPAQTAATGVPASAEVSIVTLDDNWPQTVAKERGSAVVYEPQVISWPDYQTLHTRIALALTPNDTGVEVLGTVEVSFATSTDLVTRQVTLSNASLENSNFPTADVEQAGRFDMAIRNTLAALGDKRIPLDMILMSLREGQEEAPAVAVQNAPPSIFVSQRPASLLAFDGNPVMTPVAGTSLKVAVNTNWDVFSDDSTGTWYWLNDGAWLSAAGFMGPWAPAGTLPAAFSALPEDASFTDVRSQLPGRSITTADMPQVFVSTAPAEIIVIDGAPRYTAIAGTQLQYANNTDAALIRDASSGLLYYLVSGRWFSASSLEGPWNFATNSLPPDFTRIPEDSAIGFVLASIPGTPQAQEALIAAQIPQQATLNVENAKLEVLYAGEPKFEPVPGTNMTYAVNTSFNVVRVTNAYYACYQGAWFVAPAPVGVWRLASTVPAVIYTIPPASPMYPCTYVRVYATTPTTVTYGYTAGYTMAFISAGVIVYGTGYYYPPYIYPARIPIYYPYPVTWAGATYYNSATGVWAHGGAIYGPYYGARGGTAYNPNTGAYARGGSVWGPYGGAGAFSAYNPTTGSYAHGSAVYGPDGASANASWYNARTGISGSTNQNSDAYGRWGSSTVSGPNQTVHTQSQSDSRGSAGSFSSGTGAEGAGVKGAGGNSGGAVKTSGGDVYAGADGNVYKKTDSGWEKYDNGSWNSVQKPDNTPQKPTTNSLNKAADSAQNRTSETARSKTLEATQPKSHADKLARVQDDGKPSSASTTSGATTQTRGTRTQGIQSSSQLDRDHQARTGGSQRQQQSRGSRQSGTRKSR